MAKGGVTGGRRAGRGASVSGRGRAGGARSAERPRVSATQSPPGRPGEVAPSAQRRRPAGRRGTEAGIGVRKQLSRPAADASRSSRAPRRRTLSETSGTARLRQETPTPPPPWASAGKRKPRGNYRGPETANARIHASSDAWQGRAPAPPHHAPARGSPAAAAAAAAAPWVCGVRA
jgi:hypothetical protein